MKTILIIEDDDAIRENTAELLELSNYRVLTADSGHTGFDLAKEFHPDIILCDIMMPGTDGRKFQRLAKDDTLLSKIPLIFFSAGSVSAEYQKDLVKGPDGYLKKPFTEEELLEVISRTLQKRVML